MLFQSTLPVKGATGAKVSFHHMQYEFQSTLPVKGATNAKKEYDKLQAFQSTLPVKGATQNAGFAGG